MIITFANQKGGVGKTTSAANISGFLSEAGNKVLAIDMDPSGNLSAGLGVNILDPGLKTISDILLGDIQEEVICERSGIFLIPSSKRLEKVAKDIDRDHMRKNEVLKLNAKDILNKFDYVIIDTPPSLGSASLLTLNAFSVCDFVVVPVKLNYFDLLGIGHLLDTLASVKKFLNPRIDIIGILPTFYENTQNCKTNLRLLEEEFNGKLFKSVIRKSTDIAKSPGFSKTINTFNKRSIGYADYLSATEELLLRIAKYPQTAG